LPELYSCLKTGLVQSVYMAIGSGKNYEITGVEHMHSFSSIKS
jgi:hypothetical protein